MTRASLESTQEQRPMNLMAIAARHYGWVESMGWHNKTTLESLGLIGSEIFEAQNEAFTTPLPANFGEELADIVLRSVDLAYETGVDLDAEVAAADITWRSDTLLGQLAEMGVEQGKTVNAARYETLGPEFGKSLGRMMRRLLEIAARHGIDIEREVALKMAKNHERGTRGRVI